MQTSTREQREVAYTKACADQDAWAGIVQHMRLHGTRDEWLDAVSEFRTALMSARIAQVRRDTARAWLGV